MEAVDHSFGSVVCLFNSFWCDLFLDVIKLTESYSSLLGETLYLQSISFLEAKINGFDFNWTTVHFLDIMAGDPGVKRMDMTASDCILIFISMHVGYNKMNQPGM